MYVPLYHILLQRGRALKSLIRHEPVIKNRSLIRII
jgi:hypothetical protein